MPLAVREVGLGVFTIITWGGARGLCLGVVVLIEAEAEAVESRLSTVRGRSRQMGQAFKYFLATDVRGTLGVMRRGFQALDTCPQAAAKTQNAQRGRD